MFLICFVYDYTSSFTKTRKSDFQKKNLCRFLSITAEEVGYFRKEMKTHTQISIVQGWADLPPKPPWTTLFLQGQSLTGSNKNSVAGPILLFTVKKSDYKIHSFCLITYLHTYLAQLKSEQLWKQQYLPQNEANYF